MRRIRYPSVFARNMEEPCSSDGYRATRMATLRVCGQNPLSPLSLS
jgi:hypothetical protein